MEAGFTRNMGFTYSTPPLEDHMEKKIENEPETGLIWVLVGIFNKFSSPESGA